MWIEGMIPSKAIRFWGTLTDVVLPFKPFVLPGTAGFLKKFAELEQLDVCAEKAQVLFKENKSVQRITTTKARCRESPNIVVVVFLGIRHY
ncbi:MAG: hypothetical protein ACO1OF_18730 [Adhaeribacter sp.]